MPRSIATPLPYPPPPRSPSQTTITRLKQHLLLQNPPPMRYARVQHFVLDVNIIILYLEVHHPRRSVVARLPQCGIVKRRAEAGVRKMGAGLCHCKW